MKNIKISYNEIRDDWENSIMEISIDYPLYKKKRQCYLYELFYFDTLMKKIQEEQIKNLKYGTVHLKYTAMFFKIEDKLYNEIKKYLSTKTEYEDYQFNDSISLLSEILNIYRTNPKWWSVE